ncbi:MAG: glycerol-3-phosphate 1-O-acyltransferase PlsY [Gammaproteobacteria bacterium]|nr:glycerol-3-phosphate 1-O-acyltransferase PlsY [Gammaproteobacteria bacterium]
MLNLLLPILLVPGAYLIGSISFAIVVARIANLQDPRQIGSGNPGATNMLRLGSRWAALFTLLGDLLKGTLAVVVTSLLTQDPRILAAVVLAVFLGHLYPIYFGFKGGKGVATALGAYLALNPWLALAMVLTWATVAWTLRYSSLAALVTTAASPFYIWWLLKDPIYLAMGLILALIMFWRHRSNIRNLLQGTETRIGAGKSTTG